MFSWLVNLYGAKRSGRWPAVRAAHLQSQPNCQACGRGKQLEVHHIVPVSVDPGRELDQANLITLCADPCHLVHGHLMSWRRANPQVVEDCLRYSRKIQESIDGPVKQGHDRDFAAESSDLGEHAAG